MFGSLRLQHIPLAVVVAGAVALVPACHTASSMTKVDPPQGPVSVTALWANPDDISSRDLFGGVGGLKNAPHSKEFKYLRGESPSSWGYDVMEPDGREWSVKFGEEV